jgi:hypothetical protein
MIKFKKKTQFKEKGPKNYHNQSRLNYQTDSRCHDNGIPHGKE